MTEHLLQLRQFDIDEDRPAAGAVDPRSLIIGVGNRAQSRIAQENDERRPVPDVDDDDRAPGRDRRPGSRCSARPRPISAAPNRPMSARVKICQIVPTTFHGISIGSAIDDQESADRPAACAARKARCAMPSGTSITRHDERKGQSAKQRVVEARADLGARD